MKGARMLKAFGVASAAFMAFSGTAPAQAPGMEMLDNLAKGSWVLKERGDTTGRKLCLGDPKKLLQIQHGSANCTRYVIEDTPKNLRVSYKCGNLGHGVTSIRRESNGLVQIQSQGIANNAPFSLSLEGRRTGPC